MRFLILFTFLISNVLADDLPKIKNIVIHKDLKTYDNVIFLDQNDQKINIKDFNGNLILLNFWATWCTSCIRQISNTSEMRRQLKDEDIIFLYVCFKLRTSNLFKPDVQR